ncbi:type IV pilin N-terminal domain-containing protein [Methanorbis rubei]|uniref:type IV pilin N-terminal domain-containing protein n=1 Tax=Methanorbis rubei TaxID=3028300 RepID=UPI0030B8C777
MSSSQRDAGVSPVIGTILLVAFTVVLVAVVAFIMMGLSGGISDTKDVGLLLDTYATGGLAPEHGVAVTVMGGKDAGDIAELRVSIGDPQLHYKARGNTYVPDPVTGIPYRYFADTGTYLKLYDNRTWVMTNELNNTGVLENRLVTVTGKFRDATEQVLLMKMITIPAMIGVTQQFNCSYVRVLTFTNTTGVPGHGLLITPINDSVTSVTVSLENMKDSKNNTVTITGLTFQKSGNQYFFYLPTAGVLDSPYPSSPNASRLIGNATVTVTLDGIPSSATEVVSVDIPARINFFEDKSIVSGEFGTPYLYSDESTKYIVPFTITTSALDKNVDAMRWYINNGGTQIANNSIFHGSGYVDISNRVDKIGNTSGINLTAYPGGTLDVFARTKVVGTDTHVWYRVASESISTILSRLP